LVSIVVLATSCWRLKGRRHQGVDFGILTLVERYINSPGNNDTDGQCADGATRIRQGKSGRSNSDGKTGRKA
jgi:hypothetical protein